MKEVVDLTSEADIVADAAFDRGIDRAKPYPAQARAMFILKIDDGTRLVMPCEQLQGLEESTESQLVHIEIFGGNVIARPDLDHYLPCLLEGKYSTERRKQACKYQKVADWSLTKAFGRCFALIFLALAGCLAPLAAQTTSAAAVCESSTIDARKPEYVMGAKTFLSTLQTALRADKPQLVANAVRFPLRVNVNRKSSYVASRQVFLTRFGQLFPSQMRQAVLSQRSTCLFGNDQGVMIGDGEVWFDQDSDGVFRIHALNIPQAKQRRH